MEIRRSVPSDAPEIAAAETIIFSDPWSERSVTDLISTEGAMCYTAREGDKVIAYILGRIIAPEGEIYRIATLPGYRKRGIAYRLLDYAYKTEKGRGLEVLFLEVRKNYYKDPVDDAIIMLKAHPDDLKN